MKDLIINEFTTKSLEEAFVELEDVEKQIWKIDIIYLGHSEYKVVYGVMK